MTKNGIKYYPVTNKLIDIFQGEGWKIWSRYKLENNQLIHKSGLVCSSEILKQAKEVLAK